MHVALAQHQLQLLLAEIRVDQRQGQHVEGQVPGRVPGILPLVRHGDDVAVVHVVPVVVARRGLARRLERIGAALLQPLVHVVVVELLAPQHARQGLAHDVGRVGVERARNDGRVELVGLVAAGLQHLVEMAAERAVPVPLPSPRSAGRDVVKPQPNHLAFAGVDGQAIMGRGLRPVLLRVHGLRLAVDDVVVDAVLDVRACGWGRRRCAACWFRFP